MSAGPASPDSNWELRKDLESLKLSVNYTYLDSEDLDAEQPLPLVPESQINFILDSYPDPTGELSFWGTGALGYPDAYTGTTFSRCRTTSY